MNENKGAKSFRLKKVYTLQTIIKIINEIINFQFNHKRGKRLTHECFKLSLKLQIRAHQFLKIF